MITTKYIIQENNVELMKEVFHPFTSTNNQDKQIPNPELIPITEIIENHSQLEQEIKLLKDELEELNTTKEKLSKEIADWEEKKNNLHEEQEAIKKQAEAEAKKIVEESQHQSEVILSEAKKQKEAIDAEANTNKEKIITQARKIGYKDGFDKGYQKGEQEREEIEAYLKKILNEAIRKKGEVVESIRQHLVNLVYTAVEKVVKKITSEDKKVVLRNIVEALNNIDDPVKLIIKVNYDDLKASTMFKSKLLSSLKDLQQVEVMADPSVEKGGCIVETEFTIVDSRISTQLDKISKTLQSLDMAKSQSQ